MTTFPARFFTILMITSPAVPTVAHPGHGTTDNGWTVLHYLMQPTHLIELVVIVGAALCVGFSLVHAQRGCPAEEPSTDQQRDINAASGPEKQ